MARNALSVLAASFFIVVIMTVVVGGKRGLDDAVLQRSTVQLAKFDETSPAVRADIESARNALTTEPQLLGEFESEWGPRLDQAEASLSSAATSAEQLRELTRANDPETAQQVDQLQQEVSAALAAGAGIASEINTEANQLIAFRDNASTEIERMSADRLAIEEVSLNDIEATVRRAQSDWPEKANDLEQRLRVFTGAKASAAQVWADSADARAAALDGDPSSAQIRALVDSANAMARTRSDAQGSDRLAALIEQLYWSWDKILVDMEIQEGAEVSFSHSYQTIFIPGLLVEGESDPEGRTQRIVRDTVKVSKAEFERMKNNLGMTVLHKPAGKYDHEADATVQPGGYAYIAPPGERNRYGYWGPNGWTWVAGYFIMKDLFWGRSYRPIGRDDYNGFQRHRSTGRTYFGKTGKEYGSKGTNTRATYGTSRYVQTNGYANSRYVRSGGTYRGSRYASSSRSSSSRSGGFSRSGSRSGGK
ncbi:MAG: hypothetical protein AAGI53_10310 [Planctomycetota bacterium]